MTHKEKGDVGKDFASLTSGGKSPLRAQEGQEGGAASSLLPCPCREGEDEDKDELMYFHAQPHSPSSQRLGGCSGVG